MKHFILHIGGANSFDTVLRLIYPRFDAFTFLDDPGELRGGRKSGLAVRIDSGDGAAIADAAAVLRAEFGAENVEIEYAGLRYRCGDTAVPAALLEAMAREVAVRKPAPPVAGGKHPASILAMGASPLS